MNEKIKILWLSKSLNMTDKQISALYDFFKLSSDKDKIYVSSTISLKDCDYICYDGLRGVSEIKEKYNNIPVLFYCDKTSPEWREYKG